MDLLTPVTSIPYIGSAYQKKLAKLGIVTAEDLLLHIPHRYEDFSTSVGIARIEPGKNCTVRATVLKIENKRIFKKKMVLTQATIDDGTATIGVVWFNQPYLINSVSEGEEFFFSGKAGNRGKSFYLLNPTVEKTSGQPIHTGRMVPIYSETRGLSSKWLRFVIKNLLDRVKNDIPDLLPKEILKEHGLLKRIDALKAIHFPSSLKEAKEAKRRISFEQIFLIQLSLLEEKIRISREKATSVPINVETARKLVSMLPFKLTDAQRKSAWQILKNMERTYPMNRLLEGDVGSGKTVVAAIAIANVIRSGHQAAFMAPTEILAKQHFSEVFKILKGFKMDVGLLTGKEDKYYSHKLRSDSIEISRKKLLDKVIKGDIDLLIGTHALIQDKVKFKDLALVILDEQHRFGIKQRAKLVAREEKGEIRIPHLLSMTATPIPRTLALSIYGDLDLSLIDQSPKGRKRIITKIVFSKEREGVYSFIRDEIKKGRQAFIICPRIDPSPDDEEKESRWSKAKAVKDEYEKLSKKVFPEFSLGLVHGKLGIKEKERAMDAFRRKKTDILVSTSVVEVGIDVPNATVMMIEGADRFGLAQLHQLRGRVGRGDHQSHCFLAPESFSNKTRERMNAILKSHNGFELSEKDLKLRGPGDFLGSRQWGVPDMIMGSLGDLELVQSARNSARSILESDSSLKRYPLLKTKTNELRKRMHLE